MTRHAPRDRGDCLSDCRPFASGKVDSGQSFFGDVNDCLRQPCIEERPETKEVPKKPALKPWLSSRECEEACRRDFAGAKARDVNCAKSSVELRRTFRGELLCPLENHLNASFGCPPLLKEIETSVHLPVIDISRHDSPVCGPAASAPMANNSRTTRPPIAGTDGEDRRSPRNSFGVGPFPTLEDGTNLGCEPRFKHIDKVEELLDLVARYGLSTTNGTAGDLIATVLVAPSKPISCQTPGSTQAHFQLARVVGLEAH